ncbi:S26 family signal peptidase [Embleya sp. NBC_00896]|uniref:S26 family signal peptidase n=1 Tax=Embleya sp. NBC_00896 TaxID=2975961 RepID=UPI002F9190F5|nr:S26 family signal peptidase [Embleya sp. NBC_00896]
MRGQRAVLAGVFATGVGALALWGTHRRYLVATVDGPSMEPTLHRGDRLLVRRAARARAGQIVVVRVPNPPLFDGLPPELAELTPDALATIPERLDLAPAPTGRLMIKRAVAVAGDRVPRERFPALRAVPEHVVPPGALVVLGDNPGASWDSRAYGFVHGHQLVGVAVRRIVPTRDTTSSSGERLVRKAP